MNSPAREEHTPFETALWTAALAVQSSDEWQAVDGGAQGQQTLMCNTVDSKFGAFVIRKAMTPSGPLPQRRQRSLKRHQDIV